MVVRPLAAVQSPPVAFKNQIFMYFFKKRFMLCHIHPDRMPKVVSINPLKHLNSKTFQTLNQCLKYKYVYKLFKAIRMNTQTGKGLIKS